MDQETSGLAYAATRSAAAQIGVPPPADLNGLCEQLERQIDRAREASLRIRDHAERLFGPRPENASAQGVGPVPAPTLANLIDQLSDQMTALETHLARL